MTLKELRNTIDFIDDEILLLLEERFEKVSKIIELKKNNNIPILNSKREDIIYNKIIKEHQNNNIYFIKIYKKIIEQSKSYQKHKLNNVKKTWL